MVRPNQAGVFVDAVEALSKHLASFEQHST
jgi:hypothetical protein